jgi:hypothetical protein
LVGDYRPEHVFVLNQNLQSYRFYQARIEECDREIEKLLEQLIERFESSSSLPKADASQGQTPKDQALQSDQTPQSPTPGPAKQKRNASPEPTNQRSIWPAT